MKIARVTRDNVTRGFFIETCPGCRGGHFIQTVPTDPAAPVEFNGDVDLPTFGGDLRFEIHRPDGTGICHFFVRDGQIEFCHDSTHAMAGKSAPLPEIQT